MKMNNDNVPLYPLFSGLFDSLYNSVKKAISCNVQPKCDMSFLMSNLNIKKKVPQYVNFVITEHQQDRKRSKTNGKDLLRLLFDHKSEK